MLEHCLAHADAETEGLPTVPSRDTVPLRSPHPSCCTGSTVLTIATMRRAGLVGVGVGAAGGELHQSLLRVNVSRSCSSIALNRFRAGALIFLFFPARTARQPNSVSGTTATDTPFWKTASSLILVKNCQTKSMLEMRVLTMNCLMPACER